VCLPIRSQARTCAGLRELAAHAATPQRYVLDRLLAAGAGVGHPSPLVPYTLLRSCSGAPGARVYPECSRLLGHATAGLKWDNGSWLPQRDELARGMRALFELCVARANGTFVARQARPTTWTAVRTVAGCDAARPSARAPSARAPPARPHPHAIAAPRARAQLAHPLPHAPQPAHRTTSASRAAASRPVPRKQIT